MSCLSRSYGLSLHYPAADDCLRHPPQKMAQYLVHTLTMIDTLSHLSKNKPTWFVRLPGIYFFLEIAVISWSMEQGVKLLQA